MIKPCHNFVLLEPIALQSAGGIALPTNVRQQLHRGKVLAVGPGGTSNEGKVVEVTSCKKGDVVFYLPENASRPDLLGTELLVSENSILAKECN